ncbi:MAG: hypothetical protein QOJ03_1166, partial [Frankiaceae bacterium]|nr:hypothetical protein [Frankiaceae bacterium]
MPPRTTRPQSPGHVVTAVLVSHDGARWLGDSLAALSAQVRPPQRVVAVDTGSTDGSADLVASALGESAVVRVARDTPLGVAVKAGLDAFDGAPAPPGTRRAMTEWVWLLHDDCAPEPTALRELLAQAVEQPSVACFGPKTLSWDGGRLLEMGLTVDSSGRRQTGLEERELDQGQHDEVGDVLAVGTAGMLVRRDLWDRLGGLDPAWPLFGDDVDFGWRLNAIGERIRVAPRAVVRHAAALGRGLRPADAAPGRPAAVARRHGLQVVLANTGPVLAPLLAIRYVVEALARALGLLVIRRPVAAADELVGTGGALRHPAAVLAARRQRRNRTVAHSELRSLLAPASLRGRRFGDAIAEMLRGREAAEERRLRRAPVETGPVSEEVESLDLGDTGWVLRAVRRPGVLLALALTALGLLASRDVIGAMLHGGRLLPAPAGAADLWSTYRAAWHPVGLGSTTPTPPFIAVLALFSTVLLGKVWLVVDILVLGAVPLAGLSAYLSARSLTDSWRLRMWAAVSYAVLPALTGAVAGGRIDVVAAMVLLPVVARSVGRALFAGPSSPNRWLGTGLLLAVLVAVAPIAWPMAAAALLATVGVLAGERRRRLLGAVTMLAVPLVALLPWTASVLRHPRLLLNGAGLPEAVRTRLPLPPADVLLLHPGGPAQPPLWVLAPLLLAALAALVRQRGARAARAGLVTFAIGIAATGVVTRFTGTGADPAARPWTGVPMAFAAVGMLMAGLVAAERARAALRQHSF